jgi:ethanolamine ammonia-lyase large subunit
MNAIVQEFVNNITSVSEEDYGDFMRLSNLFLNQLKKDLVIYYDRDIVKKLNQMQTYVQYSSNWDIYSTRRMLLQDASYIDDLLSFHQYDWETSYL